MYICGFHFFAVVLILLHHSRISFSKEDTISGGKKREKHIIPLNQVFSSDGVTNLKDLGKMPIRKGFHEANESKTSALEQVLDKRFEEIGKMSLRQAMDQFERFKKAAIARGQEKIETVEKSPLKSKSNTIQSHMKLPLATIIDKIEKSLKPEVMKFEDLNRMPLIPEISKFEKFEKMPLALRLNKIKNTLKPEMEKLEKHETMGLPFESNRIEKFRKSPLQKLEFSEIDELMIKKLEKSVESVKLAPLDKTTLSKKDFKKTPLKRGIDESEKNMIEKLVQQPQTETLGAVEISLDQNILDLKQGIDYLENKQKIPTAKILKDQKNPQLKRDIGESNRNKIEKGMLDITKTDANSINESEKSKFEIITDRPKNGTLRTTKIPWDRKNAAFNLVYSLDSENIALPSERTRAKYLHSGQFVPKNVMINHIQFYGEKAFVTMPKLKRGVPFSVGKISLTQGPKREDLKIEAFPSWAIHRYANISGIVNAVDIFIDDHATLWILDSGVVSTLESPERMAPPKVFAVDLRREQVIKAIDLSNFMDKTSRLQHIAVESGAYGCQFVYISDASNRGLIIWDVCNDFGSKIILPKSIQPEIKGASAPDILYLNLISRNKTSLLGVTFFSSDYLFAIPTHSLQNLKYGTVTGDVSSLGRKPGKIVMLGSERKWVYFRYAASGDVYAWDASTDFKKENFRKLYTGNGLEFATQVAVGHKKSVWALESNFQDYRHETDGSDLVFSIRAIYKSSDLT